MRIYLAGPMRGIKEFNFPQFDAGAKRLRDLGHEVFNPAERDMEIAGFDPENLTGHEDLAAMGFSLREALHADTEYISLHAEAVALLPGWQKSSGVAAEIALAHALGLPVGELADFDKDGPHTTLESPHALIAVTPTKFRKPPSGTVSPSKGYEWPEHLKLENIRLDVPAGSREAFVAPSPTLTQAEAQHIADLINAGAEHLSAIPENVTCDIGYVPTGEVRTTSATGGEKGTKPERYDLIPVGALAKVAQLYGRGAAKYAAHNWRRGYEWSKSYAALQRHATQFWNGEDNDPEMGLPHMASVAFHAFALLTFMEEQPGFDDRYKPEATEPDCTCDGVFSACSDCHTNTTKTKP